MRIKNFLLQALAAAGAFLVSCGAKASDACLSYMHGAGLAPCAGFPGSQQFDSARVVDSSRSEVIRQRLYDWTLYATAGYTSLTFFSLPIGQGKTTALGSTAATPKTIFDTNMEQASTLPSGKRYLIETIEVVFLPGSVSTADTYTPANASVFATAAAASVVAQANDVNTFYQSGSLELNVLSKNYLTETPLMCFPPKAFMNVNGGVTSTSATVGLSAVVASHADGRPYMLDPNVTLDPAVNFNVTLRWPGVVATGSGFNGRVGVILDGYMMRAAQ